jgi:hypothetical protein
MCFPNTVKLELVNLNETVSRFHEIDVTKREDNILKVIEKRTPRRISRLKWENKIRLDKYSECEGSKFVLVSKCFCGRYMKVEDAVGK